MALSWLCIALNVSLLLVVVFGQTKYSCTRKEGTTPPYSKPHPKYCGCFILCDEAGNGWPMLCDDSLRYDPFFGNCGWANQVTCPQYACGNGINTRYEHPCPEKYYECTGVGNGTVVKQCATGQQFNPTARECQQGYAGVMDIELCKRPGTDNSTDPRSNCTLTKDPTNPCRYVSRIDGPNNVPRDCAEGTEFSDDFCTCGFSTRCNRSSPVNINKMPDPQCQGSFICNFNKLKTNGKFQAVSNKYSTPNTNIPDEIETQGVQMIDGQGVFRSGTNGAPAHFTVYSTSGYVLKPPHYIVITFRISDSSYRNFELLSNNFGEPNACRPTLILNGYYSLSSFTFTLFVSGAPANAKNGDVSSSGNVSLSLVASTKDWVKLNCEYSEGSANIYATNMGPSGNNPGTQMAGTPTPFLGEQMAPCKCPLRFGYGFNGNFSRIAIHEACLDTNKGRAL